MASPKSSQISEQVDTISSQKICLRALKLADVFDRRARPGHALIKTRLIIMYIQIFKANVKGKGY